MGNILPEAPAMAILTMMLECVELGIGFVTRGGRMALSLTRSLCVLGQNRGISTAFTSYCMKSNGVKVGPGTYKMHSIPPPKPGGNNGRSQLKLILPIREILLGFRRHIPPLDLNIKNILSFPEVRVRSLLSTSSVWKLQNITSPSQHGPENAASVP